MEGDSLAKLSELKQVVSDLCGGDLARANSLIKVARGNGFFTTGGRGLSAPEMRPSDFAAALVIGASMCPPTKISYAASTVLTAEPIKIITIQNGVLDVIDLKNTDTRIINKRLETVTGRELKLKRTPHSLGELLVVLFERVSSGGFSFHPDDKFTVLEAEEIAVITLELRQSERLVVDDYCNFEESKDVTDGVQFSFASHLWEERASHFGSVQRTIFGIALEVMAKLARKNGDA